MNVTTNVSSTLFEHTFYPRLSSIATLKRWT